MHRGASRARDRDLTCNSRTVALQCAKAAHRFLYQPVYCPKLARCASMVVRISRKQAICCVGHRLCFPYRLGTTSLVGGKLPSAFLEKSILVRTQPALWRSNGRRASICPAAFNEHGSGTALSAAEAATVQGRGESSSEEVLAYSFSSRVHVIVRTQDV